MVEREDTDPQSRTITTSTAHDFPDRHDSVDETGSMQVLLAAAGLREIPASRHQEQSQLHASHGSPTTQAIPGSLGRHDNPPALGVNRQETFATKDNSTGPSVPHMDSGNTYDTTRSHPEIASEHCLRSSQDTTFHFATDPAASVELVNSVRSNID